LQDGRLFYGALILSTDRAALYNPAGYRYLFCQPLLLSL
jgi:hypothetical protein